MDSVNNFWVIVWN